MWLGMRCTLPQQHQLGWDEVSICIFGQDWEDDTLRPLQPLATEAGGPSQTLMLHCSLPKDACGSLGSHREPWQQRQQGAKTFVWNLTGRGQVKRVGILHRWLMWRLRQYTVHSIYLIIYLSIHPSIYLSYLILSYRILSYLSIHTYLHTYIHACIHT